MFPLDFIILPIVLTNSIDSRRTRQFDENSIEQRIADRTRESQQWHYAPNGK